MSAEPHTINQAARATHAHTEEVRKGERFEFGKNWSRFLDLLDDQRIADAEASLKRMLEVETLSGKRFLDIGSGSGLFSLAARRLGAQVHSFDYDPQSVACTTELRRRYFPGDDQWTIAEASALDANYVGSLGEFDVVYSWGVLHHTGAMWQALDHARLPVAVGGKLWVAIYNDTGSQTARWKKIKKTYNTLPRWLRVPFTMMVMAPLEAKAALSALVGGRLFKWLRTWRGTGIARGMSRWRDIVDWVGGYPYEAAAPEEIFEFYKARGFRLSKLKCGGVGLGCNEFVFERHVATSDSMR